MQTSNLALSLITLYNQLNERYPHRNRISDGSIGDRAHQSQGSASDHNPWYHGIVTAMDITHDPANGVDIDRITDELAASRDSRIKYIIANGLILSSSNWRWVKYNGPNKHTSHFHISVVAQPMCNDPRPWNLPSFRRWEMQLDDTVESQLTGKTLTIRTLLEHWDKWIVETYRQAQRIDELEIKIDALLTIARSQAKP